VDGLGVGNNCIMNANKEVITIKKYSVVIPRLFDLILKMNHAQRVMLLKKAEELSSNEKRKSKRKSCRIPVRYAAHDRIFSNYITNVSKNGIFIETKKPLFAIKDILLDFKLERLNESLKIKGEVAHATRSGIGVEFKDVNSKLADMIEKAVDQTEE
jgi:Tfp pilus assembly protein PilZ